MGPSKKSLPSAESRERREKLVELLEQEVLEQLGEGSTLEEENDAALDVVNHVLWRREDKRLRSAVTRARRGGRGWQEVCAAEPAIIGDVLRSVGFA